MSTTTVKQQNTESIEGKYLTFSLAKEEYGIGILKVREIIGYVPITPIPRTPDYVKGILNLRGQVIPVIDLRLRFSMPAAEVTEQTCIIVAEVAAAGHILHLGLIVDRVQEVLNINRKDIDSTPQFGDSGVCLDFILGIGKVGNAVKILLDIDRIVEADQLAL